MTLRANDEQLATLKFGVGQPVLRNEDPALVQGRGRYTDDVNAPGQVYMAMVRSSVAHGTIRSIDVSAARAMPGVIAIYTGADLEAKGYGPYPFRVALNNRDGSPLVKPKR